MNDGKISVRYAKALFQSALDRKILDKVYQDMILVSEICTLEEFKELLENPVIKPSKKTTIINNTIGKRIEGITGSMIALVVKNGRETFLPGIAREFMRTTKEHNGITESVLTTAVSIDDNLKQQISDIIAGIFKTKVELKEVVDKNIIGGFILRVKNN